MIIVPSGHRSIKWQCVCDKKERHLQYEVNPINIWFRNMFSVDFSSVAAYFTLYFLQWKTKRKIVPKTYQILRKKANISVKISLAMLSQFGLYRAEKSNINGISLTLTWDEGHKK